MGGQAEQLPLIFPEPFPVSWPTGDASLLMAIKECKRRRREVAAVLGAYPAIRHMWLKQA